MFTRTETILFRHCDPAGIVFYPRFFEMVNDTVEAYFDQIGHPFSSFHGGSAIPTVAISTTFHAPARIGEVIDLTLRLTGIGRTSLSYRIDSRPFSAEATIVHTGADIRPEPWPDGLRAKLAEDLEKP